MEEYDGQPRYLTGATGNFSFLGNTDGGTSISNGTFLLVGVWLMNLEKEGYVRIGII